MNLPERLVELMNDHGEVVFPSKCHNTIIPSEGSVLRQTGQVTVEADVILDKGLEVVPVFSHVAHHLCPVQEMVVGIAIELVSQGSEQTVAVSRDLLQCETHGAKLSVQAGKVIKVIAPHASSSSSHCRSLLLGSTVSRSDLPLNSLLGHGS